MIDKKVAQRSFLPLLLIFMVITAFLVTQTRLLEKWNIDPNVVIVGNVILFLATTISYFMYQKSLRNNRVQVFLRMIYGGMMIKMMVCLFAVLIYIMSVGKAVNKAGIFFCMFLYAVYTVVEMSSLMKLSKLNKNA
jgi:hypothetical protein